jgi:uncharacterized protein with PQ loop repeat
MSHELKDVQRVSGWVLPTAAFAPVIASVALLSPPWPDTVGLTVCTALAMMLALIFVFQLFRKSSRKRINRVMMTSLILLVTASLAYFSLFSLLVYKTPVTHERFVQGFVCTSRAELLYRDRCPWLDVGDIKEAEYEASRLWTAPSVMAARVSLLALWFAMFGTTSVLLGSFVSYQSQISRISTPKKARR